jgi:hypothetical protein
MFEFNGSENNENTLEEDPLMLEKKQKKLILKNK